MPGVPFRDSKIHELENAMYSLYSALCSCVRTEDSHGAGLYLLQIRMLPDTLKETVTQTDLHGLLDLVTPPSRHCTSFVSTSRQDKHRAFLQLKKLLSARTRLRGREKVDPPLVCLLCCVNQTTLHTTQLTVFGSVLPGSGQNTKLARRPASR